MGEVVNFTGVTSLDLPAERVLEMAMKAGLTGVVIAGYDAEGGEYFASSLSGGPECLWLLQRMQRKLLEVAD